MTRFRRSFSRHAAGGILRQFGEEITYHKITRTNGETIEVARIIDAKVDREANVMIGEINESFPYVIVRVRNDDRIGISSEELNTATDEITVALRVGATPTRKPIARLLSADSGLLRILVQ